MRRRAMARLLRRRVTLLSVLVGVMLVATLALLGGSVTAMSRATDGFAETRTWSTVSSNTQRDLLRLQESVLRLRDGAGPGEVRTRLDLVQQQLRVLANVAGRNAPHPDLADIRAALAAVEVPGEGPLTDAAIAALDAQVTAIERAFNVVADERDLYFHGVTAEALEARTRAQRSLAGAVVLTVGAAAARVITGVRRSRRRLDVAREAVRQSEERFRSLVSKSSDLTLLTDAGGVIRYGSPAARGIVGCEPAELEGRELLDLVHPEDRGAALDAAARLLADPGAPIEMVARLVTAARQERAVEMIGTNLLADPAVQAVVLNVRDVSERRRLESRLTHSAFHDDLTGLPNRSLLVTRVERALRRPDRHGGDLALVMIDLDDFKAVNDGLGHHEGDRLLVSVARRLTAAVRPGDTVARLGGDEFVVLAEGLANRGEALRLTERITATLLDSVPVGSVSVPLRASVGVRHVAGEDRAGVTPARLLMDADVAMYAAKFGGKGTWVVFEPAMGTAAEQRLGFRVELQAAIEGDGLALHYQPVHHLATGQVVGVEALVRWPHPAHGIMDAAAFVPLAEEAGLVGPLGEWVLDEACRVGSRLGAPVGTAAPFVAVNVSSRQLEGPGLAAVVERALRAGGLEPSRLVLELTESVGLSSPKGTERLRELRSLGVRLAIDDFGTGFSSLGYLKHLDFDLLKVDRSFVAALDEDDQGVELLGSMREMARSLGMQAIAEGVETEHQLASVRALGFELGQGFALGRPMPAGELAGAMMSAAVRTIEPWRSSPPGRPDPTPTMPGSRRSTPPSPHGSGGASPSGRRPPRPADGR